MPLGNLEQSRESQGLSISIPARKYGAAIHSNIFAVNIDAADSSEIIARFPILFRVNIFNGEDPSVVDALEVIHSVRSLITRRRSRDELSTDIPGDCSRPSDLLLQHKTK